MVKRKIQEKAIRSEKLNRSKLVINMVNIKQFFFDLFASIDVQQVEKLCRYFVDCTLRIYVTQK